MTRDKRYSHEHYLVNQILAEWNPIGVPEGIADSEYTMYVPNMLQFRNDYDGLVIEMKRIVNDVIGLTFFPILYKGYAEKPIARYTSMPSFSNEYAFFVETSEGKNYIVSNRLSENYWYSDKKEKVELISNKTEISNDLYLKIVDLFKLLEEQTKKPKKDLIGFDGVTYNFATTDQNGEIKIGETWSPNEKSLLGKLVEICDNIYSLGNGNNLSQSDILIEIEKLIIDLKQ